MQSQLTDLFLNEVQLKSTTGFQPGNFDTRSLDKNGLFASFLNQALFLPEPKIPTPQPTPAPTKTSFSSPLEINYMDDFKTDLMATGIPLERYSIPTNATPEIQKVLVGQGYSEKNVNTFLDDVFQSGNKQQVKMSDFFQKLNETKSSWDNSTAYSTVDSAVVPRLETALRDMGLNATQVKNAIEQSRTDGGNVDLKRLVTQLKSVSPTSQPALNEKSSENMAELVTMMGGVFDGMPVSFKQFVQMMDDHAHRGLSKLSPKVLTDTVRTLMSKVKAATNKQHETDFKQIQNSKLTLPTTQKVEGVDMAALERALRSMGLTGEEVKRVIADAKQGNMNMSVDAIIDSLKKQIPDIEQPEKLKTILSQPLTKTDQIKLMSWAQSLDQKIDIDGLQTRLSDILKRVGLNSSEIDAIMAQVKSNPELTNSKQIMSQIKDALTKILKQPALEETKTEQLAVQKKLTEMTTDKSLSLDQLINQMEKLFQGNEKLASALENMLQKTGLNAKQIEQILSQSKNINDNTALQQLIASIRQMVTDLKPTQPENVDKSVKAIETLLSRTVRINSETAGKIELAEQDMSFLRDALKSLGVSQQDIKRVINEDDGRVNFKELLAQLKLIQQSAQDSTTPALKNEVAVKMENLIGQLAGKNDMNRKGARNLRQLVQNLESALSKYSQQKVQDGPVIPADRLNSLAKLLDELGFESAQISRITSKKDASGDIKVNDFLKSFQTEIKTSPRLEAQTGIKAAFERIENMMAYQKLQNSTSNSTESAKSSVVLNRFFQNLEKSGLKPPVVPAQEIPALQTTLSAIGLQPDQINQVLAQSKNGGQAISLAALAQQLRQMIPLNQESNTPVISANAENEINQFLTRLGIQKRGKGKSKGKTTANRSNASKNQFQANTLKGQDETLIKSGGKEKVQQAMAQNRAKNAFQSVQKDTKGESAPLKSNDNTNPFATFLKQEALAEKVAQTENAPRPQPKPLPYYLSQQVGRQLSQALRNGDNQLTLQLRPPELGSLHIEMEIQNNVLKIGLAAERQATREMLMANVNELKTALSEHGIELNKVDVQLNYNFNQSMAQEQQGGKLFNENNNQMANRSGRLTTENDNISNSEMDDVTTQPKIWQGDHTVSLMA